MKRALLLVLPVSLIAADKATDADHKALQGSWSLVAFEVGGKTIDAATVKESKMVMIFKGDKVTTKSRGEVFSEDTFTLDASKTPKSMTFVTKEGAKVPAIYELNGDTLRICSGTAKEPAPKEFKTRKDSGEDLKVMKRVKP